VTADAVELRVLGCLIEKQRTTPEQYPLSLNALRLACNQSTNREPVVDYDEATVREAAQRLSRRGWARLASRGGRAVKYRHLFGEALGLDEAEVSLLAVLMLRGPQTPGELKQRTERLHRFEGLGGVHETLERLIERGQVVDTGRRPGQKENRYAHTLGGEQAADAANGAQPTAAPREAFPAPAPDADDERIVRLERELAELRSELAELRDLLGRGDGVQT
jgi:uncharacterized protein YceH (UPF0502 family)